MTRAAAATTAAGSRKEQREPLKIFVMIGPPGAGKGTQAAILAGRLGLPHVASGDLFREAVRAEDELGRKVKGYLDSGELVPDDLTTRVVMDRLARPDAAEGVILDGFPRTRAQAESLDAALAKRNGRVVAALFIGVPDDELVRRLSGRLVCRAEGHVYNLAGNPPRRSGVCDIDGSPLYVRPDDQPDTVRARLDGQLPPMYEVVDHYRQRDLLVPIDGNRPIDRVADDLMRAVERETARNGANGAGNGHRSNGEAV